MKKEKITDYKQYHKDYYQAHKKEKNERAKKWYWENRDKVLLKLRGKNRTAYHKMWYQGNLEKAREYKRNWARRNRGVKYPERLKYPLRGEYPVRPVEKPEPEVSKLNPEIISHKIILEAPKVCSVCGGLKKDKNWDLTNFCNLNCYKKFVEAKKGIIWGWLKNIHE